MISKYLKIIISHTLLGICFAFFYTQLSVPSFKEVDIKTRNIVSRANFNLPNKNTYLLKIWGDSAIEKILLNGTQITHFFYKNRKNSKEYYYIITPEIAETGQNNLGIYPGKNRTMRVKNNIVVSELGVVLFKNTPVLYIGENAGLYIMFVLVFILLGFIALFLFEKFVGLAFDKFLIMHVLASVPCLLFMLLIHQLNKYLPAKVLFFSKSYFNFCFILILVFYLPLLFFFLLSQLKKIRLKITKLELKGKFFGIGLIQWFLSREVTTKLLISFFCFLFLCTSSLSFRFDFLAEFFANIAFCLLSAAVILTLLKTKDGKNNKNI